MFMSLYVDVMMMSSACVMRFTSVCGVGVSDVFIVNNVGDRTPPCGTPRFELLLGCFASECRV